MSPATDLVVEKWKRQHQGYPGWAEHYWKSQALPSRNIVLDGLAYLQPWNSLVELGCNSGPMLAKVHQAFPEAVLAGIEPNPIAVQACQENLGPRVQVFCISLQEWLAEEIAPDVLLTHYTLAYISPEQIRPILAEMCSKAKRGLVLAEPMGQEELIWAFPEWRHNYAGHLRSLGIEDMAGASVEGVGNLNMVLAARW